MAASVALAVHFMPTVAFAACNYSYPVGYDTYSNMSSSCSAYSGSLKRSNVLIGGQAAYYCTGMCHVSPSTSMQFECGNTCCMKGQSCDPDTSTCGTLPPGVCLEGQTVCGGTCCEADEICTAAGVCKPDPCPASEGKYWCVQDEVCCKPGQQCQNGACASACPPNEVACGTDECCKTINNEICNQGRCVIINPLCKREEWQPHYVWGQIPEISCTGENGTDCCYDGEVCCEGVCCIYGYKCEGASCVWDGPNDDECVEECCKAAPKVSTSS